MPPRRTALITGAGGFCASHLASYLAAEARCTIVGLSIDPEPVHPAGLTDYLRCDVTQAPSLVKAVRAIKPDWVFHLAGVTVGSRASVYAVNARGTANLLQAVLAERPGAATVVVGTSAEYGSVPRRRQPVREEQPCRPVTVYGASKLAASRAALRIHRTRGLRVVVARPFNMIGPLMPPSLLLGGVLRQIRDQIQVGHRPAVVRVGRTDPERDFVRVEDVVEAFVRMVRGQHWGEVFNLCSGTRTTVRTLLRLVAGSVAWPVRFEPHRKPAPRSGPGVLYGSYAKAAAAFGFAPGGDLPDAVRRICRAELGSLAIIP